MGCAAIVKKKRLHVLHVVNKKRVSRYFLRSVDFVSRSRLAALSVMFAMVLKIVRCWIFEVEHLPLHR